MNIYSLIGAVIAAVIVIGLISSGSLAVPETDTIALGVIAPLSGDAAAYGEPVRNAVSIAVDEINESGGIDGRLVEPIYEDGKCNGKDAASAAQKLVNVDKVHYIVGPVCSAEAFGLIPVTSTENVFVFSPGSSAPKLAGITPYFMRTYPNDNITGVALADYLSMSHKTAAIITEATDYGLGIKEVFVAQAEKNGMHVVSAEDFTTSTADFRTLIARVKSANPDVIFINPQTSANLLRVAKEVRELGINAAFAAVVFNDPETVGAGTAVEGMTLIGTPGLSIEEKGTAFVDSYTKLYGTPSYAFFAGAAYDNVYLIKQAIEAVGDDTDKVQAYLHGLKNYDGTLGSYRFDQNGDIVGLPSVVQRIVSGKLITLPYTK
ncbi:MAG: ABC transporter substrate-binding protein [Patescibacteria group bacterium]